MDRPKQAEGVKMKSSLSRESSSISPRRDASKVEISNKLSGQFGSSGVD